MPNSAFLRLRLWGGGGGNGKYGIRCKATKKFPESRRFYTDILNQALWPSKSLPHYRATSSSNPNQKCKILLTNVSKMDNEPGHERQVFVLKVKTGSSLIQDEETKPLPSRPFPPPCYQTEGSS